MNASKKEYLRAAVGYSMGRDAIVEQLEGIGIACYDDEPMEDLIDAYIDSVEAGDIETALLSFASAKSMPHHIYMMWLDIDED